MLIIESFTIGVHNVVIGYPITVLLMLSLYIYNRLPSSVSLWKNHLKYYLSF